MKPVQTDDLIRKLSREAGAPKSLRHSPAFALGLAAPLALAVSLALVLLLADVRPDLTSPGSSSMIAFKAIAMLLVTGAGLHLVRTAATPGASTGPLLALAPAAVFLGVNVLVDHSGLSLMGARPPFSPLRCVGTITLASAPALILILAAIRRGAPTRLRMAGLFAGVLAGALGALAYVVACVNDSAGFVALWYSLAILIVAGLGALLGPRFLAW